MAILRKLIVQHPIIDAVRVSNFGADIFAMPGRPVGLSASGLIYWEVLPSIVEAGDSIYCRDYVIDDGIIPIDGYACNHYDSSDLIDGLGDFSEIYGFTADIEGLLDDGLSVGNDFSLVECFSADELRKLDPVMMAGEAARECWWIYKVALSVSALSVALASNTMGYQLGFCFFMRDGGTVRLVREVGCDMQSMDILLTDRKLSGEKMSKIVSVF